MAAVGPPPPLTRQNCEHIAKLDAYWLQEYQPRFPHPWVLTDVRFEEATWSTGHDGLRWCCIFLLNGPPDNRLRKISDHDNTPEKAVLRVAQEAFTKIDRYNYFVLHPHPFYSS